MASSGMGLARLGLKVREGHIPMSGNWPKGPQLGWLISAPSGFSFLSRVISASSYEDFRIPKSSERVSLKAGFFHTSPAAS